MDRRLSGDDKQEVLLRNMNYISKDETWYKRPDSSIKHFEDFKFIISIIGTKIIKPA